MQNADLQITTEGNARGLSCGLPVLLEGFPSAWWLWQHGYPNVVALMGSDMSEAQRQAIKPRLSIDADIVILQDGDGAGDSMARQVFSRLGDSHATRYVRVEGKQPTDLSAESLARAIRYLVDKGQKEGHPDFWARKGVGSR